jgi:hypothetical protein
MMERERARRNAGREIIMMYGMSSRACPTKRVKPQRPNKFWGAGLGHPHHHISQKGNPASIDALAAGRDCYTGVRLLNSLDTPWYLVRIMTTYAIDFRGSDENVLLQRGIASSYV